jgi:hypothetical protein
LITGLRTEATDKKVPTIHTQTLLTLPLFFALANPVLAEDDKALLTQSDGMTRAGTIDPAVKYGVIGGICREGMQAEGGNRLG